ncbi:MAG TPA: hypothetical protein VHD87_16285, partial [Acidimicrobiales bacterium]|nr:hypothetical protein [Acidimicrobiales bacterium]
CRNGAARWTVGVDVVTHGRPGATLSQASLAAAFASTSNHAWRAVALTQDGDAFTAGRLIGPSGELRTHPRVQVVLPCSAAAARLVAAVRVGANDPQRAQALFVDKGIAMSPSSVGGFALVLLVAAFAARRLGPVKAAR